MLNRKESKVSGRAERADRRQEQSASEKGRPVRRRFIISAKAAGQVREQDAHNGQNKPKLSSAPAAKVPPVPGAAPATGPATALDLAETIKTLMHLAHEHGHV